jgi:hypothetical protein
MDAYATIKLHRSGVLASVVKAFQCEMPRAVYEEVVTHGKRKLHQDAEAIEAIVAGAIKIIETSQVHKPELNLGAGELGVLEALHQEADLIVVSDDRRFLSVLMQQGAQFLTPVDILVLLARQDVITGTEAREALELLRPMVREAAYYEGREDLEHGGK